MGASTWCGGNVWMWLPQMPGCAVQQAGLRGQARATCRFERALAMVLVGSPARSPHATHRQSSRSQSLGAMVQLTASTRVLSAQAPPQAARRRCQESKPTPHKRRKGRVHRHNAEQDSLKSTPCIVTIAADWPDTRIVSDHPQRPHAPRSSTSATCFCCRSRSHSSTARRLVAAESARGLASARL